MVLCCLGDCGLLGVLVAVVRFVVLDLACLRARLVTFGFGCFVSLGLVVSLVFCLRFCWVAADCVELWCVYLVVLYVFYARDFDCGVILVGCGCGWLVVVRLVVWLVGLIVD